MIPLPNSSHVIRLGTVRPGLSEVTLGFVAVILRDPLFTDPSLRTISIDNPLPLMMVPFKLFVSCPHTDWKNLESHDCSTFQEPSWLYQGLFPKKMGEVKL